MDKNEFDHKSLLGNIWQINNVDERLVLSSSQKNDISPFLAKLLLLRNHGLKNRDQVLIPGYNSRLDTFQAVVGNWIIPKAKTIAKARILNAKYLDKNLSKIPQIKIPERIKNYKIVFHLYIIFAENRDQLLKYCLKKGIVK